MRFVPVPGYGVPTHQIPILDHDANLTAWLDRQIFSAPRTSTSAPATPKAC